MIKKNNKLLSIIYILSSISLLVLIFIVTRYNLFPAKHRTVGIVVYILMYVVIGLGILKSKSKYLNIIFGFLVFIFLIANIVGVYYINTTFVKYNNRANKIVKKEYTVLTLKENLATTIEDVSSSIYYAKEEKAKDIESLTKKIEKIKKDVKLEKGETNFKNYDMLKNKEIDYIIVDKPGIALLKDHNSDFDKLIKELKLSSSDDSTTISIEKKKEKKKAKIEKNKIDNFILYISGADTYTDVNMDSRSDVNLIVTVNLNTKKILITTIPRDSYLYMPGYGYDKLTHAGIYGISESEKTLENLLNIKIDYYLKVNFSSLIKVVDALGGVSVNNIQSFTSRDGYYYPKGEVELDGEKALSFVRERYNLENGDFDRGRNQMRVLEAIIKKAISPSILLNYNEILDTSLESVSTNFPISKIVDLINNQIEEKGKWEFLKNDISGEGRMDLESYSMPGYELYMLEVDKSSVEEAKEKIQNILNPKSETEEETTVETAE